VSAAGTHGIARTPIASRSCDETKISQGLSAGTSLKASAAGSIYGDTVTWRNSRPWALSTLRGPGRAITNRAARRAQPAKAPRVGEQLQPRPLLWLVRTHCGLGRICGSRRIPNRRDHGRDDLRKPRAGLLGFEAMTCGFEIPDSPSTRHAHRGNSGGYDAERKPVSSANVHAKTPGGPRRARTDDLRIKRAFWVCGLVRILLISCVIVSQLFARHGGGSRARADSLRTPEVRGSTRCP